MNVKCKMQRLVLFLFLVAGVFMTFYAMAGDCHGRGPWAPLARRQCRSGLCFFERPN
jgi:hypothetical protein